MNIFFECLSDFASDIGDNLFIGDIIWINTLYPKYSKYSIILTVECIYMYSKMFPNLNGLTGSV